MQFGKVEEDLLTFRRSAEMLIVQVCTVQVKISNLVGIVYTFCVKFYHWDLCHTLLATV